MSNQTLSITLESLAVGTAEAYWLTIRQAAGLDDFVSLAEAADLIDQVYDRNPCRPENEDEPEDEPVDDGAENEPPIEEPDFWELIHAWMADSASCTTEDDGSYECTIQVAKSHRNEPYKLVLDNGKVTQTTRHSEQVTATVAVDDSSSRTLELPIISDLVGQWDGPVYDAHGRCAPPELTVLGSTINFGKRITGALRLRYATEYDLVTIQVHGADQDQTGDQEGLGVSGSSSAVQPGQCRVLAFYHDTVTEHDVEPPELDELAEDASATNLCGGSDRFDPDQPGATCYELITAQKKCRCSGAVASSETYEASVDCPEGIHPGRHLMGSRTITSGYVSCPEEEGEEGSVSDAEYYEKICCVQPERVLPICRKITSAYAGGKSLDPATMALYPGAVFVAVGPKDGLCGRQTVTWQVNRLNCCEGVPSLAWDDGRSATIMTRNDADMVFIIDDDFSLPVKWTVRGQGFWLDAGRTRKTVTEVGISQWIYTDNTACGMAVVEVTNGCSTASGWIRCTYGVWQLVCSGTGCGCVDVGGGSVSRDDNVFTAIKDGTKVIEKVTCPEWLHGQSTSCGYQWDPPWPECACGFYTSYFPGTIWPPCIEAAEDWMNNESNTLCNPTFCAAQTTTRCVTCDELGGMNKRSGIYGYEDGHKKLVAFREIFEWVCE